MFIQWFILSPRNAINAVLECIHNIITYCMIFGTLMNITLYKTQGKKNPFLLDRDMRSGCIRERRLLKEKMITVDQAKH